MSSTDKDAEQAGRSSEDSVEVDFVALRQCNTNNPKNKKIQSSRNNSMKCREHEDNNKNTWTNTHSECKNCTRFTTIFELKECVLPRVVDVINLLLALKDNRKGYTSSQGDAFSECAKQVTLRWHSCNVYTKSLKSVKKKISDLFDEYRAIRKYSTKSESYWVKCSSFLSKINYLFDIQADEELQKAWFRKTGIAHDHDFFAGQKLNPPVGYSTAKTDRKWEKTASRRKQIASQLTKKQSLDESDDILIECIENETDTKNDDDDDDFIPSDDEEPQKKRKYQYEFVLDDDNDEMPVRFKNLRTSMRTVRPEVYTLMTILKSRFHMSQLQAEAAIIHVGNMLFDRQWKFYDHTLPTDKNTLPAGSNMRRVEPYLEAMALASIVEEIMEGEKMVVTYANDGSAMSGVGNYVVQSFTINNKQRALPTFSIFTESRESLKDLESTTVKILCAAVGYKYTEAQILENIDFVMTDSTSHNLNVIETLCKDHGVKPPKALTCNVHPLMMMQKKVKEVFRVLHDTIGCDKLKKCFLSDVDFANDDFVTKAMHCLSNFVNKDCSAKPWNYHSNFNNYIKPRKNLSVILKDHRFNRIFVCSEGLLYHIDDIASFLDRYRNIVNGITILDRSFVEMPILKPIFCAVSLIGIHITKPFQALLIDVDTTYSTLSVAFQKLYEELTTVDAKALLTTNNTSFTFASPTIFNKCLPVKEVCLSIEQCVSLHQDQILPLLKIMMTKIADGFDLQRGAVFGFGSHANDDTGTLFKVSNATDSEKADLDKTSVHNLGEERSVGSINNEVRIRGKRNLESASRKHVLNKSFDLILNSAPKKYLSYRKPAHDIACLKQDWLQKMNELDNNSLASKDLVNSHIESVKYKDLAFLKQNGGPFDSSDQVLNYIRGNEPPDQKNKRLYVEVRYAKNTSLRLKHSDPVFRLKRDNRNLSNEEYAENLMNYLGSTHKTCSLTTLDLDNAISRITGATIVSSLVTTEKQLVNSHQLTQGEHVAVFWVENISDVVWYLGIVDYIEENKVRVIHLKRTDKQGLKWILPENPETQTVEMDQILVKNINVIYYGVSCRVEISKAVLKDIISNLNDLD